MLNPKYTVFLTIAETGSLKKAADILGYTQTGISYLLNAIEEELGVKLFVRNYGGTVLTSEGEELLPYIQTLTTGEAQLTNKVNEMKHLDSGHLKVAAFTSAHMNWLPPMIKSYKEEHPGIEVSMKCCDDFERLEEMIYSGEVDCGFVVLPTKKKLDTVELMEDHIVAVLAEGHELADAKLFPIDALDKYPYLKTTVSSEPEIEAIFEKHMKKPDIAYYMDNDFSMLSMVSNGFGFAIFPELHLEHLNFPVVKKELEIPASRTLAFAVKSMKNASAATLNFLKTAQKYIEKSR